MAGKRHRSVRVETSEFVFDTTPVMRAFLAWGRGYQALAELVGCTVSSAHRLVNGRSPRSKLMPRVAGVLGVDLASCWRTAELAPLAAEEGRP